MTHLKNSQNRENLPPSSSDADLVAWLRIRYREMQWPIFEQAAAAIERLTADLADATGGMDQACKDAGRLVAERDRLRAELNSVNGHWPELSRLRAELAAEGLAHAETRAERDRYKAALERIISVAPAPPNTRVGSDREQLATAHCIARAALAGAGDDHERR